jgi:hypothetical protein
VHVNTELGLTLSDLKLRYLRGTDVGPGGAAAPLGASHDTN